jgi:hypothetical protein
LRINLGAKAVSVLFFTTLSVYANTASFAGYIQATSSQDFAFLSASIGDSSFNVTFGSRGQLGFSYFANGAQENATLNLIDTDSLPAAGVVSLVIGGFTISNPSGVELSGDVLVLPPLDYVDFNSANQRALSDLVARDSVVSFTSLVPTVGAVGPCPFCGPAPSYNSSLFSGFSLFNPVLADEAPEPATFALFGIGLLALPFIRARIRSSRAAEKS